MYDFDIKQAGAFMNAVRKQATGQDGLAVVDAASFQSCATTLLQKPVYDPVIGAIDQILSRTYFSIRPYMAKFKGLQMDMPRFGNRMRKINYVDKDLPTKDNRYNWPVGQQNAPAVNPGSPVIGDGYSVDMFVQNKPEILMTSFYGEDVYQDWYTIYRDQMDTAFRGPAELGQFLSGVVQNVSDKLENGREAFARSLIVNYAAAIIAEADSNRCIHLLTEYNADTGMSLTRANYKHPDNYPNFVRWVYGRVRSLSYLMTERTELFQTIVNNKHVIRHTPFNKQKVYLFAPERFGMESEVLSITFRPEYLKDIDFEMVNFWQNPNAPTSIATTCERIGADGVPVTATVESDLLYGVIFDEDALGYGITFQSSDPTPFDAAGRYNNIWLHETRKSFVDHTEKGLVLLLD